MRANRCSSWAPRSDPLAPELVENRRATPPVRILAKREVLSKLSPASPCRSSGQLYRSWEAACRAARGTGQRLWMDWRARTLNARLVWPGLQFKLVYLHVDGAAI